MGKVKDFIVGGFLLLLTILGVNKYRNNKALKENEEDKEHVANIQKHIDAHVDILRVEEEAREKGRLALEEKLSRRVSDEEVNDFLNDRYRNS